jgi:hypothetical protein
MKCFRIGIKWLNKGVILVHHEPDLARVSIENFLRDPHALCRFDKIIVPLYVRNIVE